MKTTIPILGLFAAALLTGCDKPDTTAQQLDKAQAKTVETATEMKAEMKDYTFAQRAEFTAAMQRQRDEIAKDLEQLEAKIEKSSDAVKAEAKPRLQALREQSARLGTQLDGVKDATESTWDSVKAGSKQAYADMKDGFTQARQWVSEKIAP